MPRTCRDLKAFRAKPRKPWILGLAWIVIIDAIAGITIFVFFEPVPVRSKYSQDFTGVSTIKDNKEWTTSAAASFVVSPGLS